MIRRVFIYAIAIGIFFGGQSAWCADKGRVENEEKVAAVQNRIFHKNHELAASVGYIADDPFFIIYPVSIGYTYNLSQAWGWEVARLQYFFNQERGLLKELKQPPFNVQPERFQEPIYMVNSHAVWRPFYGKSALLNRWVVNHETYLFAGPGLTRYETKYSFGQSTTEDAINISGGFGLKFFVNRKFCVNLEFRDIYNLRNDGGENNIYFGIGLGWRFNLTPRKVQEDPTLKKLDRILSEQEK
ncbi:MAG: outer membrane beta-barrel domain-containing protein [Desulfatitalea sp.]|nr:outer membrane beta-barrel domain-containing protein [Desulfatitalea sp.]NNK00969.1 outer membrane beta-barrel domain-containing protein [Desulfatitalea sp.]